MEPVKIIHAFLGNLQLHEPRGDSSVLHVPLSWQQPREGSVTVTGFGEALQAGHLEPGPRGIWVNRGPLLVLAFPGEKVVTRGQTRVVDGPYLIPPEGEARVSLRALTVEGQEADQARREFLSLPSQCGVAVFVEGHLRSVAVMQGTAELQAYLNRQQVVGLRDADGDPDERGRAPIERTRRVFEECRYADMQTSWSAGPYRIIRIRAPKVSGWAALVGSDVLALVLEPRIEKTVEAV